VLQKAIAIACVGVILLNLFGFYASFYAGEISIRQKMQSCIAAAEPETLEKLVFTETSYKSIAAASGQDEINVGGELYDVKGVSHKAGWVIVYAMHDGSETHLLNKFISWFKNDAGSDKSQKPSDFSKFMQQDFCWAKLDCFCFDALKQLPLVAKQEPLASLFLPVTSPPPDSKLS
jgi:hypothetical protein